MTKKIIEHHDFFGNRLSENDVVIVSDGNRGNLKIAKIIKITNKMVTVEPIKTVKNGGYSRSIMRYPQDLILLQDDVAANYLINHAR